MKEWTAGEVLDVVAEAVPDRLMTICGSRRSTFAESADRVRRLANYFAARGLGEHRSRDALERWECGQDRVAIIMHNDLYVDVYLGCLSGRVVPVNVNHHYSAREVADLLAHIKPTGIVYHRSLAPLLAEADVPESVTVRVVIDDGPGPALDGEVDYWEALERGGPGRPAPSSPDDLLMVCTGGTTGLPKGVLWRQADAYISGMTGMEHADADELRAMIPAESEPFFGVSPLMHAAGVLTALSAIMAGRTAVVYDNRAAFDANLVLSTVETEGVRILTLIGDVHVGPLIEALRSGTHDLSSLLAIGSGGAAVNARHKAALLELLPKVAVLDTFGSSETGGMATSPSVNGTLAETFVMHPSGRVVGADRTAFLSPGAQETGWLCRTGRVPLGYLNDREATLHTFPLIDGARVSIPGDRARLAADGTVHLVGRDSLTINTGGEKVFVEEVEAVLRGHPGVVDALVVGQPSDRWGTQIVAIVATADDADLSADDVIAHACANLAKFKVPKHLMLVDQVPRLANGKSDYRSAREIAAASLEEAAR